MANIDYIYKIPNIDYSDGFFVKTVLDNVGEGLFDTYKSDENTYAVSTSGTTITVNGINVIFKASASDRFYIGCYRTSLSAWNEYGRIETFFAVFYKHPNSANASAANVSITIPKAYVGSYPDRQNDLTITRTIQSDSFWVPSGNNQAVLANKLIPILAFHSKNRRCNSYSGDTAKLNDYQGWCYDYYTAGALNNTLDHFVPSNIVVGNAGELIVGSKIKTTFTVIGAEEGDRLPALVLDMNNGQRSSAGDSSYPPSTWNQTYSEGCIVPPSTAIEIKNTTDKYYYTGNSNTSNISYSGTASAYVQANDVTEGTKFNGHQGILDPSNTAGMSSADYSMACGIAFFMDATSNNTSFYTTGSFGISQLYPALSTSTKKVVFYANYNSSDNRHVEGDVYVNDVLMNNTYGWPENGDSEPSWATRPNCRLAYWGTTRTASSGVSRNAKVVSTTADPYNLYAIWKCNLTYNGNGGTTPPKKIDVMYGTPWDNLATSTRDHYTFNGWWTDPTGGTQVTSSTICEGSITVYAHWNPDSYTITYNPNGGSTVSDQSYNIETDLYLKAGPNRTGYNFAGWKCTTTTGGWSNTTYSSQQHLGTGKSGSVTLTAQWSAIPYTATFRVNDGSWNSDGTTANKTSSFTIATALKAPDKVIRTGYTFKGWEITTKAGSWQLGTIYNINDPTIAFNGTPGEYGDVTFTAQWTTNSYRVQYNLNNGTRAHGEGELVDLGTYTYQYNPTTVNYDNSQYEVNPGQQRNSYFRVDEPSKNGYYFVGWKITGMDSTEHGYWYNGAPQTLTATSCEATSDMGKSISFKWLRADNDPSKVVTFTAVYSAKPYTITYVNNGSSETQSYTPDTNLTLSAAPNRPGYTFQGWKCSNATGSWSNTTYSASQPMGTGNWGSITLTAQWKANTYTLSFVIKTNGYPTSSDGDGGNVPEKPADRPVTYGGKWAGDGYTTYPGYSNVPGDPDNWNEYFDEWKWDYKFGGWAIGSESGNTADPTATYNVAGNTTLYAKWTQAIQKYKVIWKDYDGSLVVPIQTADAGTSIASLMPPAPTRDGYKFTGWAGMPDPQEVRSNYEFTATYRPVTYTITYIDRGATVNPNPSSYTVQTPTITLQKPTKPGHTFVKWTTDPEGNNSITKIPNGSTGDLTLYAWWKIELQPFDPIPGGSNNDNDNFGIPVEYLDDTATYKVILKVAGDRKAGNGASPFDLGNNQGTWETSAPFGWVNDLGVMNYQDLQDLFNGSTKLFPMDIWRCRIYHPDATLQVTLKVITNGHEEEDSTTNPFRISDINKPQLRNVEYKEGVQKIEDLDLDLSGTKKRFIGNKKSCVLCNVESSNYNSNNQEMLYEAVPAKFVVKLDRGSRNADRTDADWSSGEVEKELTNAQINELIAQYTGPNKKKMTYESGWLEVTGGETNDGPFPDIQTELENARLRIRIIDTRHV